MTGQIASESGGNLMRYIGDMDTRLSDRTKREYTTRLKEISQKIRPHGDTLTPDRVIEHVRRLVAENRIAESTFRLYKAAVMYWLGQQAQALIAGGGDHGEYARAFEALREIRCRQPAETPDRTSSKKLKFFPQDCLDTLMQYARERGHRAPNATRAVAFARANLLVGLRPAEWFDTAFGSYLERDGNGEIVRDAHGRIRFTPMLIVENAKATHGRGNGQRRELLLHEITTEDLKGLVHFRELALQCQQRNPQADAKRLTNILYRPLNNLIRRALIARGYAARGIPSCYSTRHQVVADFKASDVGPREIAAFFGHSSEHTHREHYGHKRHGTRAVTFRPSPECLSRVAQRSPPRVTDTLPAPLAAAIEMWASEQDSRKNPNAN